MPVNFHGLAVADGGSGVLSGRDRGREAGRRVAEALRDNDAVALSFAGVEVASPSYLDELVRATRGALATESGRWLVVDHVEAEDVREALEMVLARNHMVMAAVDGRDLDLLGGPEHLRRTFEAARQMGGEFRAPALAERLELKLPALHQRLQALLESGALSRHADTAAARGRSHLYGAPVAADVLRLRECC